MRVKSVSLKNIQPFTPSHQYPHSPYSALQISSGTDKENLFNNQSFFGGDRFLYSHDLNK